MRANCGEWKRKSGEDDPRQANPKLLGVGRRLQLGSDDIDQRMSLLVSLIQSPKE